MSIHASSQKSGSRASSTASWSHFNKPIPDDGNPHGFSRRPGDASPEVQKQVIDSLLKECADRGLSKQDAAYVLAIARLESGFNPDAASPSSSAAGIGQFIDRTGKAYNLDDKNRFDIDANSKALVGHYLDNKALVKSQGLGQEHIYKLHHDGPTADSGGLELAKRQVMPYVKSYSESSLLASFTNKAKELVHDAQEGVKTVIAKVESAGRQLVSDISDVFDRSSKTSPAVAHSEPAAPAAASSTAPSPTGGSREALIEAASAQGLAPDAIAALVAHRTGAPHPAETMVASDTAAPSASSGSDQSRTFAISEQASVQEALVALTPMSEGPSREVASVSADKELGSFFENEDAVEQRTFPGNSLSGSERQAPAAQEQAREQDREQDREYQTASAEREMDMSD